MPVWVWFVKNLNFFAAYFTTQLVRCAMFSVFLVPLALLLRRTVCAKRIFLRGALWALFLVVPFLGRLKLFYEQEQMARLTARMIGDGVAYGWFCRVYMTGVLVCLMWMAGKRLRLRRTVGRMPEFCEVRKKASCAKQPEADCAAPLEKGCEVQMETAFMGRVSVRVTDMKVTPFTAGVVKPVIVLPRLMLEHYREEELALILRHERTHIRLGHLLFGLAWDVLRCMLWVNPLLTVSQRYFRADMEDICDRVCIQGSGTGAHEYGMVLLKSVKLLRDGAKEPALAATYAGEKDFADMKRRMEKIVAFQPYGKGRGTGVALAACAVLWAVLMLVHAHSYARCNESTDLMVGQYDGVGTVLSHDTEALQEMISYDECYVYVEREPFEAFLRENRAEGEIWIVFGGFYKLPGMGGAAEACVYESGSKARVVQIPYESICDGWECVLLKLL